MQRFENQRFYRFGDFDTAATYSDLEFHKCVFENCGLSIAHTPETRSTVRNVQLIDCTEITCSIASAVLIDVLVDGFKSKGTLLFVRGAVYKHVILRGKFDRLMIHAEPLLHPSTEEEQLFVDANAAFYRDVDWALDIREAEFKDVDIRGMPGRLVRRDVATQAIITREAAVDQRWRALEFHCAVTPLCISMFLDRKDADYVLVAPKRRKDFLASVADIELLRKAGVAEPG